MNRKALLSLLLVLTLGAEAQKEPPPPPPPPELLAAPGYLDFDRMGLVPLGESKLVVNLYGPTIRIMAEFARGKDTTFSNLLDKLQAIRAKVWQVPPKDADALRRNLTDLARQLESRGWQTAVEVRSGTGDLSFIQLRTQGDQILGLAVFFLDAEGEAGAINIVGSVTPEEIGRLGRQFNLPLPELDKKGAEGH